MIKRKSIVINLFPVTLWPLRYEMPHLADAIWSNDPGLSLVTYLNFRLCAEHWLHSYGSVVEPASLHLHASLVLATHRLLGQNWSVRVHCCLDMNAHLVRNIFWRGVPVFALTLLFLAEDRLLSLVELSCTDLWNTLWPFLHFSHLWLSLLLYLLYNWGLFLLIAHTVKERV